MNVFSFANYSNKLIETKNVTHFTNIILSGLDFDFWSALNIF